MKLIALPDLHSGGLKLLSQIQAEIEAVDLILLPGDLTNSGTVADTTTVIETIRRMNPNIFAVTGNWDSPEAAAYLTAENINLEGTPRQFEGITFWGAGGSLPFIGRIEYKEVDYQRILDEMKPQITGPHVLLCHNPPYNTLNDRVGRNEHVGSRAIRQCIEETQPLLCFSGHIHEAVGIDTIDKTQIVNPGPIWNSGYAYAEIVDGVVQSVETRKLQ